MLQLNKSLQLAGLYCLFEKVFMPQPPKIFIFAMWGITIINILLVIMNWVSFGFHFLIYNPAKIRWVIYKIYYFIYTRICNVSLLYKDIATLGCYILVAFLYVCNIIGNYYMGYVLGWILFKTINSY
tara:strand:- start:57 stop:437 length:381 start_codon:yes stop_codon:yes gene_type:complete